MGEISEAEPKIGVNLEILGTKAWGLKISSLKYAEALEEAGITCVRYQGRRESGLLDKFLRVVDLHLFVAKERLSILYSPTHHGLLLSLIPQVITLFDLQPLVFKDRSKSQRLYFRVILPFLLKGASWVIMGSHFTRLEAIKTYGLKEPRTKVVYVGSPLEKEEKDKETAEEGSYFLVVGAGLPHKNLDVLLEALAHPLARRWKLKVVSGDSPYLRTIEERAKKMGLTQLEVERGLTQEELVTRYTQALALLFPSLYEGFGMPLLEAMTLGCPAVVSRSSALLEVGDKGAVYAHPRKGKEWFQKMAKLESNPACRKRMATMGKIRAKRFSWKEAGTQLRELLLASARD